MSIDYCAKYNKYKSKYLKLQKLKQVAQDGGYSDLFNLSDKYPNVTIPLLYPDLESEQGMAFIGRVELTNISIKLTSCGYTLAGIIKKIHLSEFSNNAVEKAEDSELKSIIGNLKVGGLFDAANTIKDNSVYVRVV